MHTMRCWAAAALALGWRMLRVVYGMDCLPYVPAIWVTAVTASPHVIAVPQVNPLDGFSRIQLEASDQRAYKYFLKVRSCSLLCRMVLVLGTIHKSNYPYLVVAGLQVVPTDYLTRLGFHTETSQYSVQVSLARSDMAERSNRCWAWSYLCECHSRP